MGANNRGLEPLYAVPYAVQWWVRVFTIGFGTEVPAQFSCTRDQLGADAFDSNGFGPGSSGGSAEADSVPAASAAAPMCRPCRRWRGEPVAHTTAPRTPTSYERCSPISPRTSRRRRSAPRSPGSSVPVPSSRPRHWRIDALEPGSIAWALRRSARLVRGASDTPQANGEVISTLEDPRDDPVGSGAVSTLVSESRVWAVPRSSRPEAVVGVSDARAHRGASVVRRSGTANFVDPTPSRRRSPSSMRRWMPASIWSTPATVMRGARRTLPGERARSERTARRGVSLDEDRLPVGDGPNDRGAYDCTSSKRARRPCAGSSPITSTWARPTATFRRWRSTRHCRH